MTEWSGAEGFEERLLSFHRRLDDLRGSWTGDPAASAQLAEAALLELDLAAEELTVRHEEMRRRTDRLAADKSATDHEKQLFRAAFMDAATPALVIGGEDAVIKRANTAALRLLGISPSYASGRPFPVFVDLAFRAPLRSMLAAVARRGGTRVTRSRLVRRRLPPADVTLLLTRLDLPASTPHILIGVPEPYAGPGQVRPGPQETAQDTRERVGREDLVLSFARLLLDPGVTTRSAGRALLDGFSDWLAIDLVTGGTWRREVSLGPVPESAEGPLRRTGELARQVHAAGRTRVVAHLEDLGLLGYDEAGAPLAVALKARSVVCAPLGASGALTAVRTTARAPFTLAEAALLEELCELLAARMALGRAHPPDGGAGNPGGVAATRPG
ncbi:hypothetical protein Ssi03_48680 [Sphaerisporangium siamense]|uniref:PAS domain-containing protein n=1 Tax=Sphaerisporangium siamense TaxID=795645 RepID=A0A7W7D387_9ACTN|nr:hypothetical protein [Sphaerisporangium siamense]MBB4699467.1 PAS domain-containing protein [Sphaerisporangium siamense]GII86878.1 hypothetical protein Ssi03_48680 [Sphaerisporangium siamense]